MRIRDHRTQIGMAAKIQRMFDAENRKIALIIAILVGLSIKISRIHLAAEKIDVAPSAHSKKRKLSGRPFPGGDVENPVLIIGGGLSPDVEADGAGYLSKRITIAYQIGSPIVLMIQGAFYRGFQPAESIQLKGLLM